MSGQDTRQAWVDVAKGASILLVVVYHATLYLRIEGQAAYAFVQLNTLLEPVRMPLFFCLSGFLAAGMLQRGWGDLFRRRILLFAYLFALWSILRFYFYRYGIENTLTPSEGADHAELLSGWLVPSSGLWFIWALALYALIAKALYPWAAPALAVLVVLSAATFGQIVAVESFAHHNVLAYAPYFMAGAWYGRPAVAFLAQRPCALLLVSGVLFAGLLAALSRLDGAAYGAARAGLSAAALVGASAVALFAARWSPAERTLSYFGRNTLPIYVAHTPIVSLLAALLAAQAADLPLLRYWGVPLTVLVATAAALALHSVAERAGLRFLYALPQAVTARMPKRA